MTRIQSTPTRTAVRLGLFALLGLFAAVAAIAAPTAGRVSQAQPVLAWDSEPLVPSPAIECNGPDDPSCTSFRFVVDEPADPTAEVTLTLTVTALSAYDWEFALYDPHGSLVERAAPVPGQPGTVVLSRPASGTYTVAVAPFDGGSYSGQVVLSGGS